MMKSKKKSITENTFRELIRHEIKKILEAEEVESEKDEQEPEQPEEEEAGLDPALQTATEEYIRKLKDSEAGVDDDSLVEMVSSIIDRFVGESDRKLTILKNIKTQIVR